MKNKYRKPINVKQATISTVRILLTVALLAITAIVFYYGISDGWESVMAWFTSRWACLIAVILVFAGAISLWFLSIIKNMKGLSEDEEA